MTDDLPLYSGPNELGCKARNAALDTISSLRAENEARRRTIDTLAKDCEAYRKELAQAEAQLAVAVGALEDASHRLFKIGEALQLIGPSFESSGTQVLAASAIVRNAIPTPPHPRRRSAGGGGLRSQGRYIRGLIATGARRFRRVQRREAGTLRSPRQDRRELTDCPTTVGTPSNARMRSAGSFKTRSVS